MGIALSEWTGAATPLKEFGEVVGVAIDNSPEFTTKWSKAGESITNVNTPEEEAEIKG